MMRKEGPFLTLLRIKMLFLGYKGSVQGVYTQSVFAKYLLGTSHYFKNDKFSLFGNYTINPRKDNRDVDSDINFINDLDEVFAGWDTQLNRVTNSQAQQANLIADYDLDEKNRFKFNKQSYIFTQQNQGI